MAAPTLTGLDGPTFNENTVNATPQVIDSDVTFSDADGNFNGGVLTVSGLLAQDRVSVKTEGLISFNSGTGAVSYNGIVIGTAAGGSGATFTVTFNAAATSAGIEALIEHLTYANVSDTPTASRSLLINFRDAAGEDLLSSPTFTQRTGSGNPFNGVDAGDRSAPTFADLDGDGDLDALVGELNSGLRYYQNTGNAAAPTFTELTGVANPFDGLNAGLYFNKPTLADVDGDGDLDAVVGSLGGGLAFFRNVGSAVNPVFVENAGVLNPFNGLDAGDRSAPTFADLDGDGDLDLVVGHWTGLRYFANIGSAIAPQFSEITGAGNPFNGVNYIPHCAPDLADLDGDGDFDALVGDHTGPVYYFENTGTALAPVFTVRNGTANPFNGLNLGLAMKPSLADLDGDGDMDTVIGAIDGSLNYFENTTVRTSAITVTVTAEDEGIIGDGGNNALNGTGAADIMDGGDGDDTLDGGTGDDVIVGGSGNDYLRGGLGADAMSGGTGNDTYVVDDAGDTTDETGGDGIDLVHSRISWTLGSGLENLTLGNGGAWSGTGNALANVITGNSLANTLTGLAGADTLNGGGGNDILNGGDDDDTLNGDTQNDTLNGGAGSDTLNGGAHNDALDGGTGADTMIGGTGHDSYVVDDAGDVVTEDAGVGTGTDTVSASISYTLTANVENLTLTGSATNGDGNELANRIDGTSTDNVLYGRAGADVLNGMAGSDVLGGESGNDILDGGADNDILSGGAGQDRLTGGSGADVFFFYVGDIRRTGPGFGLTADKDVILDLSFAAGDRIDLSFIDANAILDGDQAFTFVSNFTGLAGQATLKFISGKSVLQLDVDGDRKADLIVEINGNVTGTTTNLYTDAFDTDGGWVL